MPASDLPRPIIDAAVLDRAARVIKVVGHPLRLRILEALESGELHVAELQALVGSSQAAVSQHLGILRAHGVVDARRDGFRVYYRIIEPKVVRILDCIRECDLPEIGELVTLADLAGGLSGAGEPIAAPAWGARRQTISAARPS